MGKLIAVTCILVVGYTFVAAIQIMVALNNIDWAGVMSK